MAWLLSSASSAYRKLRAATAFKYTSRHSRPKSDARSQDRRAAGFVDSEPSYFSNQCGRLIANVVIAYNSIAAVGIARPVSGNGKRQGIGFAQTDFTGGVAAPAFSGALCLQRQAQSD